MLFVSKKLVLRDHYQRLKHCLTKDLAVKPRPSSQPGTEQQLVLQNLGRATAWVQPLPESLPLR